MLSPVLSSLFIGLKSIRTGGELFLINDTPHRFLPALLNELEKYALTKGRKFTFLNFSPQVQPLQTALVHQGWKQISSPAAAILHVSFHRLQQKVAPSFTLVKAGHVLDIRSKALSSLWARMNTSGQPSSLLTIIFFNNQKTLVPPGKKVTIYSDGRVVDKVSLNKNLVKTYTNPKGLVTVRIEKGKAWIQGASCPHKICCFSPPISTAGERIICAPSRFLLDIGGPSFVDTAIG